MFCVRTVHMPSLKAWLQGTGAPAHLQLVQRPTGQCACKSHKAGIADPIPAQTELRVRNMQEKIQRKCEKGRNG